MLFWVSPASQSAGASRYVVGSIEIGLPSNQPALASACACRTNVIVMLRTWGDPPPQAPTITAAASTARPFAITLPLRMSIACPADGAGGKGLRWLGAENPRKETPMAIDPSAVGAVSDPMLFEWTDRDTLLYALGVGAGLDDLSFTTENSHGIDQQVLPTYAVICAPAFGAAGKIGTFNWAMLLHGSQGVRLHAPLPAAGKLSVVSEVTDIQDKGEGKNAVVMLRGRGTDPDSGSLVAETLTTLVIRGEGGFGGQPGQRPVAPEFPDREPDARVPLPTREDQALIYRLSGDRNPLHSH